MTITYSRSRLMLTIVWLAFFVANLGGILIYSWRGYLDNKELLEGLEKINAIYVTYVGAIITFHFSGENKITTEEKRAGASFFLALAVSLVWNIIPFILIFRVAILRQGTYEDAMEQISVVCPLFSWLVAPAIGFYFAKSLEGETQ